MNNGLKKIFFWFVFFALGFQVNSFAEEITLVLLGQTHAMLYPCDCPIEPDGGIARRATLIQQLKKANPNLLILDSGCFFAGGTMDPNTLGEELDKSRSIVHLQAMEMMGYDAVTPGLDEFNFGREFLEETIRKTKIHFLGANIAAKEILPYTVKKFGNVQVGIIGLVNPLAETKAGGLSFLEPQKALKEAVAALKKEKVNIFVLMSGLDEVRNQELLKNNPEINILIEGARFAKENVSVNAGPVLVLSPRWEGRRLVAVTFSADKKGFEVKKVEDLRLWDKLADDQRIVSSFPPCYADKDCKKEGMFATCVNSGKPDAQCQYKEAPKVALTVITKTDCRTCDASPVINLLKKELPGLAVKQLDFPGAEAEKLIQELGFKSLPIFLLAKNVEKEQVFEKLKVNLELKGEYYFLKPQVGGIGYFLGREKLAERLDVFFSLLNKDSGELLDTLKEFSPEVHFLAVEDKGNFSAAGGNLELEEYLRSVCVKKYYPGLFYNYITCRAKNFDSSWWDECMVGVDLYAVRTCARGNEGKDLLRDNVALNRELEIANGPAYLMDNQEIFGSVKIPKKEEFRKILLKR